MEILLDDAEFMREDAEAKEEAWKRKSYERSANTPSELAAPTLSTPPAGNRRHVSFDN